MNRTLSSILRVCTTITLILASCLSAARPGLERPQTGKSAASKAAGKTSPGGSAASQSQRNIGKAYYEQGKYIEAIGEFQKIVASGKALASDHFDLGLALMQANKLDEALGELTTAKQMDPKLVAADYNLGILCKRELRYPDAEAALKRVIAADAEDPAVWFNLGTVYFAEKRLEDALAAYLHVVNMGFGKGQNFYVASLFRTFNTYVRLKRDADAQKALKIHEVMRDKVPGISLQNPALEGGKYGAILIPAVPPSELVPSSGLGKVTFADLSGRLGLTLPAQQSPSGDLQSPIKAADYSLDYARRNLVPLFGPSIAFGDYNSDGHTGIYVVNPGGANHLLRNNGEGTFTDVTDKAGVAGTGADVSATFADYNNSGKPSLFVAGLDGVRLYRNLGDGTFQDETKKAGLDPIPGELETEAVLFDADVDGFLDLVVTAYTNFNDPPEKDSFLFPNDFAGATTHFYRNNGDGTFTEITSSSGLASARGRMRGGVFADFDNDGYTDLCLFRDDGPPLLYANLGENKFVSRSAEAGAAFTKSLAYDIQVADFNHDGRFDLALWGPKGYQVLMNQGNWKFVPLTPLPPVSAPKGIFAFRGMVVDANGDSFADLLARDASGKWRLIVNHCGKFREGSISLPASSAAGVAMLSPMWLSNPGKLDLVGLTLDGQLLAYEKEGPSPHWLEVKLIGYKSNNEGIGSLVEVKAGNYYSKAVVTGSPIRVFAGNLAKVDVVRVTWPNAVIQNWIDVATDKPIDVRESERLATSCPLLYAWNGQRYVFVTDVLGTAPLGELAPDGTRIKPFPEEFVRLPSDLQAQNGRYVFQLTDELREVDSFDQLRLLAVDHPAAQEVYSNEIYSSSPPPPTLYSVREKRFPVSAVDDQGHDVLPLLLKRDDRYPTDFARQRILGLAQLHSLTLDLGDLPASACVSLWLNGWVFWTDSNGSRALMSNKQLEMISPYLQVRNARGEWETVIPDMGLPSGTRRAMRVDLTGKFPTSDHHLRIVTNLCVYWDQIFFSLGDALAPAPIELPLLSADLHYRGFSTPLSDPQHLRPDSFDYENVLAEAPWNPAQGRYTRYGPVEKLLARADDRLVVMAPGDEITVRFDGRGLPPLKSGWIRDFFLYTYGWAKDGEPNTAFASTVRPLPFRKMANYPPGAQDPAPFGDDYCRYLREYLTRPGFSLIPPLAPALSPGL
jgi:tetratricopeptide (TPR) repeat protein